MFFLTFQSDVLKQSLPVSQSEPHVHSTQFWWVTFNCSQCANNNEQLAEVTTGSDVIMIQFFSSTMHTVKVHHCDSLCHSPVLKSLWTSSSLCLLCSCLLLNSCESTLQMQVCLVAKSHLSVLSDDVTSVRVQTLYDAGSLAGCGGARL